MLSCCNSTVSCTPRDRCSLVAGRKTDTDFATQCCQARGRMLAGRRSWARDWEQESDYFDHRDGVQRRD